MIIDTILFLVMLLILIYLYHRFISLEYHDNVHMKSEKATAELKPVLEAGLKFLYIDMFYRSTG